MNVRHLIKLLEQYDPELPVRLEVYGCGQTAYEELNEEDFVQVNPKYKKDPPPFLKIDAVYN